MIQILASIVRSHETRCLLIPLWALAMMPYFVVYKFHFGYFVRGPLALQVFADSCQARVSWSVLLYDKHVVDFINFLQGIFYERPSLFLSPKWLPTRSSFCHFCSGWKPDFFEDKDSAATAKKWSRSNLIKSSSPDSGALVSEIKLPLIYQQWGRKKATAEDIFASGSEWERH